MKLSDNQKLISELLANFDPKARTVYLGSLATLDQDHQEKLSQSAHSIREMLDLLTRNVKFQEMSESQEKGKEKKGSHKKKMIHLLDPLGGPPKELHYLIDMVENYKGWFLAVAHHGKFPTEKQFIRKLEELESLLLQIMRPHFEVTEEIDKILSKGAPSESSLKEIRPLIARDLSSYDYYFTHASGDWLPFLVKKGYFKSSPSLIRTSNGLRFPLWSPSRYLARIANERSEEVLKIIMGYKIPKREDRNLTILEDFVLAATRMPSNLAKKVAKRIVKENWTNRQFFTRLDELIADLMIKLSNDSHQKDAIGLARILLDVKQGEAYPHVSILEEYTMIQGVTTAIDHYSYEQILKNKIPILAEKDPKSVTLLLTSLLNKAIFLENKGRNQKDSKDDTSFSWRPAIEDHEQNWGDGDFRSLLVESLRDILESEGHRNASDLKKELKYVGEKRYPLFRRLELHIYRKFPKQFKRSIESALIGYFDKWELKHEYYNLIKETFPILSKKTRNTFLDLVKRGPRKELVELWEEKEKLYGNGLVELRRKAWTVERLEPVSKYLTGKKKEEYEEIVKEMGRPALPDFISYHSVGMEPARPVTELGEGLDVDAVIDFVKSYKVKEMEFPLSDGTMKKFQDYVESNPLEYAKRALDLADADPHFATALLSGIEKSLEKGKTIEWKPTLSLCTNIVQAMERGDYKPPREYDILRQIAYLLQVGLMNKENSPSFDLRNDIWDLLSLLVCSVKPEKSWEANYPGKNWDSHGISINTASGVTFHAVFQYLVWCDRHLRRSKTETPEFVKEVKELLEEYLEQKITNTISLHAAMGFYLPNLFAFDKKWTIIQIPKIFTKDNQIMRRAAWDSYLLNNVYADVFKELKGEYSEHVRQLKNPSLIDGRLNHYDQSLINHVALAYLYKIKGGRELFEEFLKTDSRIGISHCAHFIGQILKNHKEKSNASLDLDVLRFLWKSKLADSGEVGFWFINSPFTKKETMDLFLICLKRTNGVVNFSSLVQEDLESYAKDYPVKTAECLEMILKSEKNRFELYGVRGHTKNILTILLKSRNKKAVSKAKHLIHYLGTLGFNDYGKLLK